MSSLSKRQAKGKLTEARLQLDDIAAQIHEVLRDFDVLSSKTEKYIFKYAFFYFIGLYLLFILPSIIRLIFQGTFNKILDFVTSTGSGSKNLLLIVVGISLILWSFNVWRWRVSKTLRDVFEKKRITMSAGDINKHYLEFLENYHNTLRSPKRYLLIGSLVVLIAIYYVYENHYLIPSLASHGISEIIFTILYLISIALIYFGCMYCLGIMAWTLFISGRSISKLSREFGFRIDPAHPDKCGGLKVLGSFCFGAVSPILIGSAFFIGYIFVVLLYPKGPDLVSVGLILFVIILYGFPLAIFTFFLPLGQIHTKMLREREIYEDNYAASIAAFREQIQVLLNDNQFDLAKTVQEKMKLTETLFIPYPTWPFNVKMESLTTFFGAGIASFLLGVITALGPIFLQALQQHK